jgi:ABC-type multidrug transport system ATPase subunit
MSAAITSVGLTKRFRSGQVAVDSIDLDVPRGAVYGFLGPNGSGKTTTIRMLLGLVQPTKGTHTLLGAPMPSGGSRVLPAVGALVEGPAFHPYLSGRDNLLRLDAADRTVSARNARERTDHALERVGLAAAATKRYRSYSLGMRQRLGLAAALLRPRDLLVLDEPTNGLDPQGTREVRSLVRELGAGGATVFVSSHLLPEIEQVCDHVGVMSHGRLVFQGTLAALRQAANARVRVETSRPEDAARVLRAAGTGAPAVGPSSVIADLAAEGREAVPTELLVERLVAAGVPVRELVIEGAGLEDLFVGLTGEGFDVDQ